MRAVDDWDLGAHLADERDKTGHLGVVDECNVHTAFREWTALGSPAKTVLEDPRIEVVPCLLGEAEAGVCNALEDVVVVLCCSKYAR